MPSTQRRGVGDRIDPRNFQHNAALMEPVALDIRLAGRSFPIRRQQPDVRALRKTFRKVSQNVGNHFAVTALRANQTCQQNKVVIALIRHGCEGVQPAVVDSLPPTVVPSVSSSSFSSSSSSTTSSS